MSLRTLRTLLLIGLCLAGAVIIAYEGPSGVSAAIKAAKDRKAAPDFELKDAKAPEVKLASYKGQGGAAQPLGYLVWPVQGRNSVV
jgi:hypothetical protein